MKIIKKHFYIKIYEFKIDDEIYKFLKDLEIYKEFELKFNLKIKKTLSYKNVIWIKFYTENLIQLLYLKNNKDYVVLELDEFINNNFKKEFFLKTINRYYKKLQKESQ